MSKVWQHAWTIVSVPKLQAVLSCSRQRSFVRFVGRGNVFQALDQGLTISFPCRGCGAWRLPFFQQLDARHRDSVEYLSVAYSSLSAKPEPRLVQQDMITVPLAETKTIHRHFAAASAGKAEIEGYASLPDSRVGFARRDR